MNKIKLFYWFVITMMFASCVYYTVFIINYFHSPSVKDFDQTTKRNMYSVADTIFDAIEITGHNNVLEYIYNITGTRHIPQTLSSDLFLQICKDVYHQVPLSSQDEKILTKRLIDAWKQPIIITLTTNQNGEAGVIMHSFGKNKQNETGNGDDIILWFDADMYNPGYIGGPSLKREKLLEKMGVMKPSQETINNFIPPYSLNSVTNKP